MPKPTKLITIRVAAESDLPIRFQEAAWRLRLTYGQLLERWLEREAEASSEAQDLTGRMSDLEQRFEKLEMKISNIAKLKQTKK